MSNRYFWYQLVSVSLATAVRWNNLSRYILIHTTYSLIKAFHSTNFSNTWLLFFKIYMYTYQVLSSMKVRKIITFSQWWYLNLTTNITVDMLKQFLLTFLWYVVMLKTNSYGAHLTVCCIWTRKCFLTI